MHRQIDNIRRELSNITFWWEIQNQHQSIWKTHQLFERELGSVFRQVLWRIEDYENEIRNKSNNNNI